MIKVVSRETEFGIGGAFLLASLIPIAITILGSATTFNPLFIINFGGIGIAIGFIGFYLMGAALFRA